MSLDRKRILIVEDDVLNRVVYQMTLGVSGAFLDFDRWGRDSIGKLRASRNWHLIVLDLMLPGGQSGFDIFTKIRALSEYSHVPIVAVSASEPSIAIPRARDLGFSGFISKPIDEGCFVEQIERIIAGEQIWHDGTVYSLHRR
ncbi:MAG: response regulator [Chloroflexi bacterium]|nr:response regulator [Chloroflexota bacterium]